MAINTINIGAAANDGTGDPIRNAFDTVNENFQFVQGGLFAGTESSIISAVSVTGGYIISNTYINSDAITSNNLTITGSNGGNLVVQSNGALIYGNVTIVGNLSVSGSQQATQASSATAPILLIHANATPYTFDDGRDIGLQWQYYDGADKYGFLGWQNATGSLVYLDNATETSNVITAGTFGNVQFGQLLLSNNISSTSNVTGALQVIGGVGIGGNLYVQSNVFVGNNANVGNLTVRGFHVGDMNFAGADTIFINGSPVQTAATAFNGGTVGLATIFSATTQSTSAVSGAVQVRGGLGVAGNIWAGNIHANIGGNIRANVQGNIFTAAQPFITSVGTLTSLTLSGQLNTNDISPNANQVYNLGTGTSDRWSKIWTFDMDLSGTLTGGTINGAGGTHTGNIAINTGTAAALTTTTTVAEVFNTGATTVRIGAAGVTEFDSNTRATSNTTGAVVITGGLGIIWGNIYVGGSAGNAIVAAGRIVTTDIIDTSSNTQATSTSTGALHVQGGASITQGNLYIGGSGGNAIVATGQIATNGQLDTSSNTQATSTSTGALHVQGGASITQGNLYIGGSGGRAIIATGNIVPSSNIATSNNIGSDTLWWNNFYGVATQARYADLAEKYVPDAEYKVATVVVFGGDQEITVTSTFADTRVAGVISENPAHLMNAGIEGLPVALRGRVPVQVLGAVSKGDLLVTSAQAGFAQSVGQNNSYGAAVFAKSLTTNGENGSKIIEAVII
jgi:hypothetical protein